MTKRSKANFSILHTFVFISVKSGFCKLRNLWNPVNLIIYYFFMEFYGRSEVFHCQNERMLAYETKRLISELSTIWIDWPQTGLSRFDVKTNDCALRYGEQYAGKPSHSMLKSNRVMVSKNRKIKIWKRSWRWS